MAQPDFVPSPGGWIKNPLKNFNMNSNASQNAYGADTSSDLVPSPGGWIKNPLKGYNMGAGTSAPTPAQPSQQMTLGGMLGGSMATSGAPSGGIGGVSSGGGTMPANLQSLTDIADPWNTQRGQYQGQLSSLMKDPSSFLQSDLWKASTAAGLEGINRSAAAGGMLKSGNRLQALMDYGQKNAPENFFRMADLLSGLGGAKNQNPGGGLSALTNMQNANTSAYNAETSRLDQQAGVNRFDAQQQAEKDQINQLTRWQQEQQAAQKRKETLPSYMW